MPAASLDTYGSRAWACGIKRRRKGLRLVGFLLVAIASHALVSVYFRPRKERVAPPVIHVQEHNGFVEIHSPHAAKVYYATDGSLPSSTNSTELYMGPFALLPGLWQIAAVAARDGRLDSEVARFPALRCARDEDGVTVFCEQHVPPQHGAPLKSHPFLRAGRCSFPAGASLRQVTDIFVEQNVTIVNVSHDSRQSVGGLGVMASNAWSLCRQVASRDWPECRRHRDAHGGGALAVASTRQYIAGIACGFIGFAARPRRQRLAGIPPEIGPVVFDSQRYFRHQAFVPPAVTGYQGADGGVADIEHHSSLALGTSAGSFGSEALHQVLPPLCLAQQYADVC